ncbi:MAG: selenide, water dikinase SelD [Chloroflexi bacterium]|nr:selenide, water dikinase SelD [Chloroflexota bacterium]
MAPEALAQVLRPLSNLFDSAEHPDLLVGLGVPDDAAVYRLNDEQALIFTTDFFTPIVDDAFQYGAIAAANALSDVYAMGGQPLLALNIAAFPNDLPPALLAEILRGGAEKVREAGAVIAGGHTIQDKEPKVGLAVVGMAHPDALLTKAGAQPGDLLILTKPIGTGTITTAGKNDQAEAEHIENAVQWMTRLNRAAAEAAVAARAHAATDITGFGLLGHGLEIAQSSEVSLQIDSKSVPLFEGVMTYAEKWIFPGGSANNKAAFEAHIEVADHVPGELEMLLYDAQTSGGLLISLADENLERFAAAMEERTTQWWQIGRVAERGPAAIMLS